jgi:group I intron endonuclease
MVSAIYAIVNQVTRDMYVGSAVTVNRRWATHRRDLAKQCHYNSKLQRAYDKYGKDAFDWEIIQPVEDKKNLVEREQFWMNFFVPAYNNRPVADSPLGTKHSLETRAKMSAAHKGRVFSDKHKANLSASAQGRVISEERKKHLSEINKGKITSEETRAKIGATSVGRYHTDAAKQKISVANKARWAARKGL